MPVAHVGWAARRSRRILHRGAYLALGHHYGLTTKISFHLFQKGFSGMVRRYFQKSFRWGHPSLRPPWKWQLSHQDTKARRGKLRVGVSTGFVPWVFAANLRAALSRNDSSATDGTRIQHRWQREKIGNILGPTAARDGDLLQNLIGRAASCSSVFIRCFIPGSCYMIPTKIHAAGTGAGGVGATAGGPSRSGWGATRL